jgi:hypothetical protein
VYVCVVVEEQGGWSQGGLVGQHVVNRYCSDSDQRRLCAHTAQLCGQPLVGSTLHTCTSPRATFGWWGQVHCMCLLHCPPPRGPGWWLLVPPAPVCVTPPGEVAACTACGVVWRVVLGSSTAWADVQYRQGVLTCLGGPPCREEECCCCLLLSPQHSISTRAACGARHSCHPDHTLFDRC